MEYSVFSFEVEGKQKICNNFFVAVNFVYANLDAFEHGSNRNGRLRTSKIVLLCTETILWKC